jgi:UrcA family protein
MDTTTSPTHSASSKLFSVALAAGVGLWITAFATGMATAEPDNKPTAPVSAPVSYGDLDVGTEAGARVLLARITVAAKSACGELTHSPLLPREGAYHRECVAEAVDATVKQVDSPVLAALNKSEAGITLAAR